MAWAQCRLLKEKQGAPALVRFERALMLAKFAGDRTQERRATRGLAAAARLQARQEEVKGLGLRVHVSHAALVIRALGVGLPWLTFAMLGSAFAPARVTTSSWLQDSVFATPSAAL